MQIISVIMQITQKLMNENSSYSAANESYCIPKEKIYLKRTSFSIAFRGFFFSKIVNLYEAIEAHPKGLDN